MNNRQKNPHPAAALLSIVLTLALATPALAAQATRPDQTAAREITLPEAALGQTLIAISNAWGVDVVGADSLVSGKRAPALAGVFTLEEALTRALDGAGLGFNRSKTGAYVVAAGENRGNRRQKQDDKPLPVEQITVEGAPIQRGASTTKMNIPLIDTPAAIQIIPRDIIEEQGARRLADVVRNISGVRSGGTNGNRYEAFMIRGFSSTRIARDGFLPAASFGDAGQLGLANVERVEVLKGPASVLYGLTEPGGLINIVTKKPEAEPYYSLIGRVGSFDFYRSDIDFNQPLTADGRWLARLNASYQDAGSFRDRFIDSERIQIAPSLRWLATSRTMIDLDLEYYKQDQQHDYGVIAVNGKALALPRERFLGERGGRAKVNELRLQASVDHRFSDDWSLRALARFSDTNSTPTISGGARLAAGGRMLNRFFTSYNQNYQNYALQANLAGKFETGPIDHSLILGMDGSFMRFESTAFFAGLDPIDIFNPVYGATPGPLSGPFTQDRRIDFYGVYLQDMISFGEHWKLLLGGRYDMVKTRFDRNDVSVTDKRDRAFSPRAGLVYQPIEDLSLYASYTTSFLPPLAGAGFDGQPFKPEEGEQFELGVKRDWFGGRLSTTLAAFQLTRSNLSTPDIRNPGFSLQVGEQRSRGIEFDIAGELVPGWRTTGSLAYLDARITKDNRFPIGNRLINAPEWSGSLWTTYAFQDNSLRGLEVGGGLFVVGGDRKAGFDNKLDVDGYTRVDLFARYKVNETVTLALNVNNLFDKYYAESVLFYGSDLIEPSAPRSVFGTIEVKF